MLRSLIIDPEDKRFGQPKPREEMSADEKRYIDEVWPETDAENQVQRAKAALERDRLLRAAEAVLAREAKEAGDQA